MWWQNWAVCRQLPVSSFLWLVQWYCHRHGERPVGWLAPCMASASASRSWRSVSPCASHPCSVVHMARYPPRQSSMIDWLIHHPRHMIDRKPWQCACISDSWPPEWESAAKLVTFLLLYEGHMSVTLRGCYTSTDYFQITACITTFFWGSCCSK